MKSAEFWSFQRRFAARDSNTALPNTSGEKNGEIHAGAENSEKVPDLTCRICKTFFQVSLLYISLIHICVINRYFYKLSKKKTYKPYNIRQSLAAVRLEPV